MLELARTWAIVRSLEPEAVPASDLLLVFVVLCSDEGPPPTLSFASCCRLEV